MYIGLTQLPRHRACSTRHSFLACSFKTTESDRQSKCQSQSQAQFSLAHWPTSFTPTKLQYTELYFFKWMFRQCQSASCNFFTSSDSQTGKTNPTNFLSIKKIYWNLTHWLLACICWFIMLSGKEHHKKSPLKWLSSPFLLTAQGPYCPPSRYTSSFVHTEVKLISEKTVASVT